MRKPISVILTSIGKREPKPNELMIRDPHSKAVVFVKKDDVRDYTLNDWRDFLIKLASHPAVGLTFIAVWKYAEDKEKLFKLFIEPALLEKAGL